VYFQRLCLNSAVYYGASAKVRQEIAIDVSGGIVLLELAGPFLSIVDPALGIASLRSCIIQTAFRGTGILSGCVANLVTMLERLRFKSFLLSSIGIFLL
jgi:hypothetical protein